MEKKGLVLSSPPSVERCCWGWEGEGEGAVKVRENDVVKVHVYMKEWAYVEVQTKFGVVPLRCLREGAGVGGGRGVEYLENGEFAGLVGGDCKTGKFFFELYFFIFCLFSTFFFS